MQNLLDAFDRASNDAALYMTADLRRKATERGWSREVVNAMRVVRKGGDFIVKVPAALADQAWVHEYGDPDNTPTATIRNYDSRHPELTEFYGARFSAHSGGLF